MVLALSIAPGMASPKPPRRSTAKLSPPSTAPARSRAQLPRLSSRH